MNSLHEQLRRMTPEMFAHLGEDDMVYIKPIASDAGVPGFAIHSATGQELAVLESWEEALTAALVNNMRPARLH